jgi:hypothetical protein
MTGLFGTSTSILGRFELGAGASSGGSGGGGTTYNLSATSVLALNQTQDLQSRPVRATSALSLSQVAAATYPAHLAGASALVLSDAAAYVGPKNVAASSAIVFADSAYIPQSLVLSAGSTLTFSQSSGFNGTVRLSANSAIALTSIVDTTEKIRDAASTIAFSQSATVDKIKIAQSQLTLNQEADKGVLFLKANSQITFNQSVSQGPRFFGPGRQINLQPTEITLNHSATTNIFAVEASSQITLAQNIVAHIPRYVTGTSLLQATTTTTSIGGGTVETVNGVQVTIGGTEITTTTITGLNDEATVAKVLSRTIWQNIPLTHTAVVQHLQANAQAVSGSSTISFTQSAILSKVVDAESTIVFAHSAQGDAALPASSTLSLSQSATVINDHAPQSALSTIELNHGASFLIELGNTRFLYSPFIGENTDPNAPTPPPASLPYPLSGQPAFQVVYPPSGLVTDALQIRAPNFGNKDQLGFQRINRETRGGKLIVFADPIWPKTQTMVLQFSALHQAEANAVLTFLYNHLGQQVGIVDWEWNYWIGVITDPNQPIVQDSRDSFSAAFSFEGVYATWTQQTVPITNLGCSSTSQVAVQNRNAMITCDCTVDTQTQGYVDSISAETDGNLVTGTPVYITAAGHVAPAVANNGQTAQVVGLSLGTFLANVSAQYTTEGEVTSNDWTGVTGSSTLQPGYIYFLDPATPGRLTTVPPTSTGQYIVPVGRALSTTTLAIELSPTILL